MSDERGGLERLFKEKSSSQKQQSLFGEGYVSHPQDTQEIVQPEPIDTQTGNLFTGYIPPVEKRLYSDNQ